MRYSAEHKEGTRRKILDAAAKRFRAEGYDGLGVDGLAKAAGVTNGAFYGHFTSKADAYREVVVAGLDELREGVTRIQADGGADWARDLAEFYFSDAKLTCAETACALPTFAPETARAPQETREAFQTELMGVAQALAEGLDGDGAEARAWTMLALMAGGVTLARAVPDPTLSARIVEAIRPAIVAAAAPPSRG